MPGPTLSILTPLAHPIIGYSCPRLTDEETKAGSGGSVFSQVHQDRKPQAQDLNLFLPTGAGCAGEGGMGQGVPWRSGLALGVGGGSIERCVGQDWPTGLPRLWRCLCPPRTHKTEGSQVLKVAERGKAQTFAQHPHQAMYLCETLEESPQLSEPSFPHLYTGVMTSQASFLD